jgi:hypothetical protein
MTILAIHTDTFPMLMTFNELGAATGITPACPRGSELLQCDSKPEEFRQLQEHGHERAAKRKNDELHFDLSMTFNGLSARMGMRRPADGALQ